VAVGADGGLEVAGMEWLGARVYDPASRGFLSVDPLDPHVGAGWAGNPYSYAGNDPLHALDPLGLMIVAGAVMVATGVGGPAGMMLISAGADTMIQKFTTGTVNWGQVAISGAMGAAGAGLGAYVSKAGLAGTAALRVNIVGNAAIGATGSTGNYVSQNWGNLNLRDGAAAAIGGGLGGGVGGASTAVGTGAARMLGQSADSTTALLAAGGNDFVGGFGGSVTENVIAGDDVDLTRAGLRGAAGTLTGTVGRQAEGVLPVGYVGQHRAGGPPGLFNQDWGSAGAGVPLGNAGQSTADWTDQQLDHAR
jgi:RHS repeat-associated protein